MLNVTGKIVHSFNNTYANICHVWLNYHQFRVIYSVVQAQVLSINVHNVNKLIWRKLIKFCYSKKIFTLWISNTIYTIWFGQAHVPQTGYLHLRVLCCIEYMVKISMLVSICLCLSYFIHLFKSHDINRSFMADLIFNHRNIK